MTQKQITVLESQVQVLTAQLTMALRRLGMDDHVPMELADKERPDYIAHGSDKHAALLGLVKDEAGEWALGDTTVFGPQVTEKYLAEVLRQKISVLSTSPPAVQSLDRRQPNYAPPMFVPTDGAYTGAYA